MKKSLWQVINKNRKFIFEEEDKLDVSSTDGADTDLGSEDPVATDDGAIVIDPEFDEESSEDLEVSDGIDNELEALFIDFEEDAIDSHEAEVNERKYSLKYVLFEKKEEEEAAGPDTQKSAPSMDVEHFAANVARLVKNYDTLLDMKTIILKKALKYLEGKYDRDVVKMFMDVMSRRHDIETRSDSEKNPYDDNQTAPLAVGAFSGGA
jgi:hypothetical protein